VVVTPGCERVGQPRGTPSHGWRSISHWCTLAAISGSRLGAPADASSRSGSGESAADTDRGDARRDALRPRQHVGRAGDERPNPIVRFGSRRASTAPFEESVGIVIARSGSRASRFRRESSTRDPMSAAVAVRAHETRVRGQRHLGYASERDLPLAGAARRRISCPGQSRAVDRASTPKSRLHPRA